MKTYKKYIPILIIIIISISSWGMGIHEYFSIETIKENEKIINSFIESNYITSCLIFSITYIFIISVSIPGATFMTVTGGLLFGQSAGTLINVISATFGATIFFLSARIASKDLIKKAGNWVKKMQNGFHENEFSYLLTLRLVPLFPFVAVNLVSAVVNISIKTFVTATFIGIIPGTFVYTSIGVALKNLMGKDEIDFKIIIEPSIILALFGLGLISLTPALYKRIKNKTKKAD